jgi:hypothetical protein
VSGAGGTRARAVVGLSSLLVCLSLACRSRAVPATGTALEFRPQSAAFVLPFGGEATQDFRLVGSGAGDARLSLAGGAEPDLRVEALPAGRDGTAGIRLHARASAVGDRVGTLLFSTGLPEPAKVPLLFALRVRGTLRIVPTNPILHLGGTDAPSTVIDVSSARPDFVVSAVEVTRGPFVAVVERGSGSFKVTVTLAAEKLPDATHGAVGTLVVISNDEAEPRKEIPLFAFGAASPP